MNNLVNSASNMSEYFYEDNVQKEVGGTHNYCDQGVISIEDFQRLKDILGAGCISLLKSIYSNFPFVSIFPG